jgi:hypothetical protein
MSDNINEPSTEVEFPNTDFDEILETQVGNDPKSENCKISSVISDESDYNLCPEYQRGEVWNNKARSELILSIFQNICIPSIIVSRNDENVYDVIDGKQRLTTLFNFINNRFPIIWNEKEVYYSEQIKKGSYHLTSSQQKRLKQKSLVFCVYDNLDLNRQRSIFEKINYGEDLKLGEKLKGSNNHNVVVLTKLKTMYMESLENLCTGFKNKRDSQYLIISAICAILSKNETYGSIGKICVNWIERKDIDLERDFDSLNNLFNSTINKLNKIKDAVFKYIQSRKGRSCNMLNRADYLMFIYALTKDDPIKVCELIQFSKYLYHVDKETMKVYSKENIKYKKYKTIGSHGTNNSFYKDKFEVMTEILSDINKPNNFSQDMRAQIFGKTFPVETNKVCKICNEDTISSKNFDAAHIISRQNGGLKHIKNLIAICRHCNQTMGTTDMDIYQKKMNRPSLDELNVGI